VAQDVGRIDLKKKLNQTIKIKYQTPYKYFARNGLWLGCRTD